MISLIKLKNGVEIIGSIKQLQEDNITIEEPIQINYKPVDYSPMPVVSFSRYCPLSSEDVFKFDMDYVLHVTPVRKEMEEYYLQSVVYYKEVISKKISDEIMQHLQEDQTLSNEKYKDYLRKVKINGYTQ